MNIFKVRRMIHRYNFERLTLQPKDQINQVAAEKEHHTSRVTAEPLTQSAIVYAVHLCFHMSDLAQLARFHHSHQFLYDGRVSVHVAH